MDDAVIGEYALVGAGSFVRAGLVVPPRTLVVGAPARVVRELTAQEIEWQAAGTREYQALAERCLNTLKECEPLRSAEAHRPDSTPRTHAPLHTLERDKQG